MAQKRTHEISRGFSADMGGFHAEFSENSRVQVSQAPGGMFFTSWLSCNSHGYATGAPRLCQRHLTTRAPNAHQG